MSPRTVFLSRLIGLYSVLASVSMFAHKQAMLAAVNALIESPPAVLILGVFTLAAGLALVLGHNVWSAGAGPPHRRSLSWLWRV
jgi:hypothetical protein